MSFLNIFRRLKPDQRKEKQSLVKAEDKSKEEYLSETADDYAELASRVKTLLIKANTWGKKNNYPLYDIYPQFNEIQAIGEKLNSMGGIKLMRKAYHTVEGHIPYPGMSEYWWDRIGNWQA